MVFLITGLTGSSVFFITGLKENWIKYFILTIFTALHVCVIKKGM